MKPEENLAIHLAFIAHRCNEHSIRTYPLGSDEPDDDLVSRVEKRRPHLGKLLPQ